MTDSFSVFSNCDVTQPSFHFILNLSIHTGSLKTNESAVILDNSNCSVYLTESNQVLFVLSSDSDAEGNRQLGPHSLEPKASAVFSMVHSFVTDI
jgi:hypothetical protein